MLVDDLRLTKVELGDFKLEALRTVNSARRLRIPVACLPDCFDEVFRAETRFRTAWTPYLHRTVDPPRLPVTTKERDQIRRVVGVQMREEHLVELVHRQTKPCEVCKRTAAQIEHEQVSFGIADFDENTGRSLRLGHERVATAQHRHPQLSIVQGFFARDEDVGILSLGRTNDRRYGQSLRAAQIGEQGQSFEFFLNCIYSFFVSFLRGYVAE